MKGAPDPLAEDYDAIARAYDHALTVAGSDQGRATELFQEWVLAFNARPDAPSARSPERFYELISSGEVAPAAV